MEQLFITGGGKLRQRWQQAFPAARALARVAEVAALPEANNECILWLELENGPPTGRLDSLREAVGLGARVVVMSATPTEAEAFAALNEGARAYCHIEAVSGQLREIALVVQHGGLWMLPGLVRRLVALSQRVVPASVAAHPQLDSLTSRELEVAEQVARGGSNREIADALGITERTVKAHLSIVFEKLTVRDRVQLALAMNNIPTLSVAS
jgi:DNA-binding NarL/FixJ family response regulator